ncbi:hypothetical protein ONE63_003469 [Megalurothrips usitatus]|uniref:Uncharacterized protein n=1 Tax=Megalurothrips usitatus TaxID=439358 RepID=A0AAV7XDE8_9NEOP|nr:hypothetical protein ONE63_003469 [Megalurothrips usitatus]
MDPDDGNRYAYVPLKETLNVLMKDPSVQNEKCFKLLNEDLEDLEKNGIDFMRENIPVFLQFFVGDNLGSHFLGGFVESFTATHFCRYCEISKNELVSSPAAVKPFRTFASYRHAALRASAKGLTHFHGVKEMSVFNQLSKFKVTDPGLPSCLGHDLFHGVVDAISENLVAELDGLVQSYLEERKFLPNNQKPKHHYLRHYADLIRLCGPIIHLWGMRFEHKHQFFKKVARTCNNFINLLLTLSTKFKLLFAYESHESRFKNLFMDCKPFAIEPDSFSSAVTAVINTLSSPSSLMATRKITINGIKYCKGDLLILGKHGPSVKAGWIEAIVLENRAIHFVLKNRVAKFNSDFGVYEL